ncbi:radical SAM protein [Sulfitobacter sp. JB4-11]|uniref:radical SAM protein n=1 Tax=Sulfitobacter rhodophyticola TaxID=3238304 RepID=UPI003D818D53
MAASASLMLHLTGRCNLECAHCYMDGGPRRRERLPKDWVLDAIRSAPDLGIASVFLTGGEPMLYPHLTEVLRVAGGIDDLDVTLSTNATLMNGHVANLLSMYGIRVHVSIDGPEKFHDDFRGEVGAFQKTEQGLAELRRAGVPFTIVTTVSQGNLADFQDIARWSIAAGAERLLVQPLLSLGRGQDIEDQTLTSPELLRLIMAVSDLANAGDRPIKTSVIGGSKRFFLAHPCAAYVCNGGGCHRGVSQEIKKIVVRESGVILPEATNLDERYAIGWAGGAPLAEQIKAYFSTGYDAFDRLCRAAYHECVPDWPDPILPWDQILSERSRKPVSQSVDPTAEGGCSRVTVESF